MFGGTHLKIPQAFSCSTQALFTSLSAEETQGWNLRKSAATEEHDENDALSVVLRSIAAWWETNKFMCLYMGLSFTWCLRNQTARSQQ